MIRLVKLILASAMAMTAQPSAAQVPAATAQAAPAMAYQPPLLSAQDSQLLRDGLRAARARDLQGTRMLRDQISDPTAKKILQWALVDTSADQMAFFELDAARRDFSGWPRAASREQAAEKALALAPMDPDRTMAWFEGAPPRTVEGAIALADAMAARGREREAQALIRGWWRDRLFDSEPQSRILARFGGVLTQDDHVKRLDTLLMGPQGPATEAMIALVPADHQALARARMALRSRAADANARFAAVPSHLANDPGLAFERARYFRGGNLDTLGYDLLARFPSAPAHDDGQDRMWSERRNYFLSGLRNRNWRAAYASMAGAGYPPGERMAESEFFAGWVALTKLNDPALARRHFEALRTAGTTPITQGRALYWLGRAAEAQGRTEDAQGFYRAGAQHIGAFYGQLAAEKAGLTTLTLPAEPVPTVADRQRFEGRELVRAARILAEAGEKDLFKVFVLHIDDSLPSVEEYALLMDLARYYNEPFTAMMVGRAAAGKGYLLPERMYPVRTPPSVPGAPDPAFVLAITRQESSFDPSVRSHADARGMMQLLPSTARGVARRLGVSFDESRLFDAAYNMQLGTYHLGELLADNSGSYILTAVAYNAGPARPPQWIADCGDPRTTTDPLDFIECVPFTETRNYMMRVMENMQVYRARLNGGSAPITLSAELKRGGYTARPYTTLQ